VTITVTEAAMLLGIGRTAAYEAARRGELPTRRLGHRLVVPVPWLINWLEGR
jgi:excisionase family DNA binding protein